MALHEVATEAAARGERAFEIHQVARFLFAEIRAAEGFAGEVGGEMSGVEFDYREAAAVHGDAVAESCFARDFRFTAGTCTGEADAEAAAVFGVL
jgi:hypothetical protein